MEENVGETKQITVTFEVPIYIDKENFVELLTRAIHEDDEEALDFLSDYTINVEAKEEK